METYLIYSETLKQYIIVDVNGMQMPNVEGQKVTYISANKRVYSGNRWTIEKFGKENSLVILKRESKSGLKEQYAFVRYGGEPTLIFYGKGQDAELVIQSDDKIVAQIVDKEVEPAISSCEKQQARQLVIIHEDEVVEQKIKKTENCQMKKLPKKRYTIDTIIQRLTEKEQTDEYFIREIKLVEEIPTYLGKFAMENKEAFEEAPQELKMAVRAYENEITPRSRNGNKDILQFFPQQQFVQMQIELNERKEQQIQQIKMMKPTLKQRIQTCSLDFKGWATRLSKSFTDKKIEIEPQDFYQQQLEEFVPKHCQISNDLLTFSASIINEKSQKFFKQCKNSQLDCFLETTPTVSLEIKFEESSKSEEIDFVELIDSIKLPKPRKLTKQEKNDSRKFRKSDREEMMNQSGESQFTPE